MPIEPAEADAAAAPGRDRRNFWILALHHIIIRIGWIFKTETVIMPGFLDALGAGGAVRGCLPVLGRIGQSVPQFVFANRVRRMPLQKWSLAWVSFGQGLPWMVLAALVVLWPNMAEQRGLAAAAFLVIYAAFNITFGNWVLLSGTIQGKLIPAERRGRLLGVSNFWGCGIAALAALVWLGRWLALGIIGYAWIFGAVAASFLIAGLLAFRFDEPVSHFKVEEVSFAVFARGSWRLIVEDKNFRRLIWVVTLYYMVLILFPHYAAYGRLRLGLGVEPSRVAGSDAGPMESAGESPSQLSGGASPRSPGAANSPPQRPTISTLYVLWVVVQNLMNAFGSALVGPLADRRGNRLAISVLTVLAAATPPVAIGLTQLPDPWGHRLFWIVFMLLGFTPITQRIIVNYALEISPEPEHARYLGTLNLAQGFPLLFSPLFGWLIDLTSFETMFVIGAGTILLGGVLAQRLVEPRQAGGQAV